MFNKPITLTIICFFLLVIFTSFVKNKARNLEKDISKLKKNISSLNKHLSDAEIDFTYLSNPGRVKKYLIKKNKLEYSYFESSRIFNSIEHFTESSRKQTKILKKDIHE